ncbi:uncharacterized protein LOC131880160 [Tigriopus californicus]|uniref:uncharacterized protein LOC131880160 n=1 Tax=Tigriopus californicus TaxID=6832 RepID=UPI0027DAB4BA|nr:uncharacterized protein LOC131880160 [Tigriopus californicus]
MALVALVWNVFSAILSCGLLMTMIAGSMPSQAWSYPLSSLEQATDSGVSALSSLHRTSRNAAYNKNRRHRHHHHQHHHHQHQHHHDLHQQDRRIEDAFSEEPLTRDNLSSIQLRYETIPISEVNPKDLQKTVTSFKVVEEQLQGDRNEEELEDEENEENEENEPVQGKEKVKENHLSIALESSSEPADSMEGTGGSIETLDLGHAPRANRSQVDSPNSRSLRTILSQTNDHLVEEEAQRKEKMDQFMKSFANKSQVQGERTTLKKMDPEDERNDALDCPDCHGNRVCDKRTKMCRIPCGPGYPVCPLSESCLKTGFCSKVNEWLLETARPAVRVNQEYSENHDYADQEDGTTEGNSTYLEPLKDQTRLSERKIMPIIQNGLDRLKTSLKIVFQDMIEEFGLSSVVVQKIE